MITWDFYARRTGNTLEKFLSSVSSYDEALEKFEKRGIAPAEYSDIMRVFALRMSKNFNIPKSDEKAPKPVSKSVNESVLENTENTPEEEVKNTTTIKAVPRQPESTTRKRRPRKRTNNKNSKTKNDDKEYFRKVLPEKK